MAFPRHAVFCYAVRTTRAPLRATLLRSSLTSFFTSVTTHARVSSLIEMLRISAVDHGLGHGAKRLRADVCLRLRIEMLRISEAQTAPVDS